MVLTHTIETDGRQADANQHMVLNHTIQTDVFDPYNRNRWPHNSRATAFCHAWPILLFVFQRPFILLLVAYLIKTTIIFNIFLRFNCIIAHATVLKENAENARILAKILPSN